MPICNWQKEGDNAMKKTIGAFLAVMCVISTCFVAGNADAKKKINEVNSADILSKQIAKLEMKNNAKNNAALNKLYFELGKDYYTNKKDYRKALQCFDKALDYGETGILYYYKGSALLGLEKYDEAMEFIDKALTFDTLTTDERYYCYRLKGYMYSRNNDFIHMEENCRKILDLDPSRKKDVERDMILALQKQGKYVQAVEWMNRITESDENRLFVLHRKADMYCEMGQYDACEKIIRELEEWAPNDEMLNLLNAQLCYARGDYDTSSEYLDKDFKRANREKYYDCERYIMEAQIALAKDRPEVALNHVFMIERDPMPTYIDKLLGDIYVRMGNNESALVYYRKYLDECQDTVRTAVIRAKVAKLLSESPDIR